MLVNSIFTSIQGEGSWIGRLVTFVRLQGCSLGCPWCDTKESWLKDKTKDMSISDILTSISTTRVVITGGEPTEQEQDLKQLISELHKAGKLIQLESNGTYTDYKSIACDWTVVSPKPATGYVFSKRGVDELKYVVDEKFDIDAAIPESVRQYFAHRIWLQPCDYPSNPSLTRRMYEKVIQLVERDERLRAGIQLHKIYGVQ